MTPLPCPCGRGMRAVLPDFTGNPVRLADVCKACSGEAIRAADAPEPKLVLHWRHRTNEASGHGEPLPASVVEAHVADANRRFPEILHWAEPATPGPARERAAALIDALNKDSGGHVVHGALQAAMIAEANAQDAAHEPPRTLPVTPAERFLATCLRAWVDYHGDVVDSDKAQDAAAGIGLVLMRYGFAKVLSATPAGRDLLARVEAAERTLAAPPGICQGQMRAYRCALPVGHTGLHADEGRFTLWPDAADTRPVVDAADAKGLT